MPILSRKPPPIFKGYGDARGRKKLRYASHDPVCSLRNERFSCLSKRNTNDAHQSNAIQLTNGTAPNVGHHYISREKRQMEIDFNLLTVQIAVEVGSPPLSGELNRDGRHFQAVPEPRQPRAQRR